MRLGDILNHPSFNRLDMTDCLSGYQKILATNKLDHFHAPKFYFILQYSNNNLQGKTSTRRIVLSLLTRLTLCSSTHVELFVCVWCVFTIYKNITENVTTKQTSTKCS